MIRFGALLVIALLLLGPCLPAYAGEEKSLTDLVGELRASLDDANATWKDHWRAYRAYMARRDTLDADKKAMDEDLAQRASAELRAGLDAYAPIQSRVAEAVRRTTLPASGWIMGFFGASLLWGGLFVCIAIAIKDPVKIADDAE